MKAVHGKSRTKEYHAWAQGKTKGGMCPEWETFEPFFIHMGLAPTSRHELFRRNPRAKFGPGNCVWVIDGFQLTRSRFRYVKRSAHVTTLLSALGIEYRKMATKDFWEANKEHLPAIFAELQVEARDRMRALHPDVGGDGHEFGAFVTSYNKIKKQFVHHGATSVHITPENPELLVARQGSGKGRKGFRAGQAFFEPGTFRNPAHVLEIMKLIRTGLSNRAIAKALPVTCPHFIAKVRSTMPLILCPCGRPVGHKGWCHSRPRPAKFVGNGHLHTDATRAVMREKAIIRWAKRFRVDGTLTPE